MAGVAELLAGVPAAVGGVGQHLHRLILTGEQLDPDRPVGGVGGVTVLAVISPVSGSTAMWALKPSR